MTFIDKVNYYAKGILAGVGAVVTYGAVVVQVTSDGTVDGGEVSLLVSGFITLVGTVIAVIMKRNIDPPNVEK